MSTKKKREPKPLNGYITISKDDQNFEIEKLNFVVEKSADDKAFIGTVLKVSKEAEPFIKPGDRVAYNKHAITLITLGDEQFVTLRYKEVFLVI